MSGFLHTIQSLPEKRRYGIAYAILFATGLIVVSLLGVVISGRITSLDGLGDSLGDTALEANASEAVSPIEGFFGSFGSVKKFFLNESMIQQDKTGRMRITLFAGDIFSSVSEGTTRGIRYIYEHWLTRKIEN